ncbi:hypothetical protein PAPYR_6666 [Paratrimastix pyriformis]|uniref:Uncharacterized protein n=1 Tax=Paratrimastix pyriformis TaxID=342808 RepID=A0ABQ8ULT8_9EUKA|nr:hypothetical protein PAPYR_6666 [Paratrimastix pyriformis]
MSACDVGIGMDACIGIKVLRTVTRDYFSAATLIGTGCGLLVFLVPFLTKRRWRRTYLTAQWRFNWKLTVTLTGNGFGVALQRSLTTVVLLVFFLFLERGGPLPLAAGSIATNLYQLFAQFMLSISAGLQIIAARHLGQNQPAVVSRATWTGLEPGPQRAGGDCGLAAPGIWVSLTPSLLPRWSASLPAIDPGRDARHLVYIVTAMLLCDVFSAVLGAALRAAGDIYLPLLVDIAASGLVLLLPTWFLAPLGVYWPWLLRLGYALLMAAFFVWRFLRGETYDCVHFDSRLRVARSTINDTQSTLAPAPIPVVDFALLGGLLKSQRLYHALTPAPPTNKELAGLTDLSPPGLTPRSRRHLLTPLLAPSRAAPRMKKQSSPRIVHLTPTTITPPLHRPATQTTVAAPGSLRLVPVEAQSPATCPAGVLRHLWPGRRRSRARAAAEAAGDPPGQAADETASTSSAEAEEFSFSSDEDDDTATAGRRPATSGHLPRSASLVAPAPLPPPRTLAHWCPSGEAQAATEDDDGAVVVGRLPRMDGSATVRGVKIPRARSLPMLRCPPPPGDAAGHHDQADDPQDLPETGDEDTDRQPLMAQGHRHFVGSMRRRWAAHWQRTSRGLARRAVASRRGSPGAAARATPEAAAATPSRPPLPPSSRLGARTPRNHPAAQQRQRPVVGTPSSRGSGSSPSGEKVCCSCLAGCRFCLPTAIWLCDLDVRSGCAIWLCDLGRTDVLRGGRYGCATVLMAVPRGTPAAPGSSAGLTTSPSLASPGSGEQQFPSTAATVNWSGGGPDHGCAEVALSPGVWVSPEQGRNAYSSPPFFSCPKTHWSPPFFSCPNVLAPHHKHLNPFPGSFLPRSSRQVKTRRNTCAFIGHICGSFLLFVSSCEECKWPLPPSFLRGPHATPYAPLPAPHPFPQYQSAQDAQAQDELNALSPSCAFPKHPTPQLTPLPTGPRGRSPSPAPSATLTDLLRTPSSCSSRGSASSRPASGPCPGRRGRSSSRNPIRGPSPTAGSPRASPGGLGYLLSTASPDPAPAPTPTASAGPATRSPFVLVTPALAPSRGSGPAEGPEHEEVEEALELLPLGDAQPDGCAPVDPTALIPSVLPPATGPDHARARSSPTRPKIPAPGCQTPLFPAVSSTSLLKHLARSQTVGGPHKLRVEAETPSVGSSATTNTTLSSVVPPGCTAPILQSPGGLASSPFAASPFRLASASTSTSGRLLPYGGVVLPHAASPQPCPSAAPTPAAPLRSGIPAPSKELTSAQPSGTLAAEAPVVAVSPKQEPAFPGSSTQDMRPSPPVVRVIAVPSPTESPTSPATDAASASPEATSGSTLSTTSTIQPAGCATAGSLPEQRSRHQASDPELPMLLDCTVGSLFDSVGGSAGSGAPQEHQEEKQVAIGPPPN